MTKMETAAEKVAGNVLLTAAARVVMVLGVPATLAVGVAFSSEVIGQGKELRRIDAQQAEVARRLLAVEEQNRADGVDSRAAAERFARIEAALAGLAAQGSATLRSIERVERFIDGRRDGGPR
jgi:hypothetical protein